MKSRLTRLVAVGGASVLASAVAAVVPLAAHAASTPPYEPDTSANGTITLYDASGNQVTTGSVTSPLAAYFVSSAAPTGSTKAQILGAQPDPSQKVTADWNKTPLTSVTTYPVSGSSVPAAIATASASHPVVTGSTGDEPLSQLIGQFPNSDASGPGCAYEGSSGSASACTNTGYENLYQLRLYTLDSSGNYSGTYSTADVIVSNATYSGSQITSGTWTEVYPTAGSTTGATPTKTTFTASPKSVKKGAAVKLTASVTPTSGTTSPSGTIQFLDNGKNFGSAAAVGADGTRTLVTKSLPVGRNSLTASFTPSDSTYSSSKSGATVVTVNGGSLRSTKKPTLSGTARVGKTLKVNHGSWSPSASSYGYQWLRNGKAIKHATHSTYKLTRSDKNKRISCRVTAKKAHYINTSKTTSAKHVSGRRRIHVPCRFSEHNSGRWGVRPPGLRGMSG